MAVTNTTFINNRFRRIAPVIQIGDFEFDYSGNSFEGPQDSSTLCRFAARFKAKDDYVNGRNAECIDDFASIPSLPTPAPTPARTTPATTPAPTTPESGDDDSSPRVIGSSLAMVLSLLVGALWL